VVGGGGVDRGRGGGGGGGGLRKWIQITHQYFFYLRIIFGPLS